MLAHKEADVIVVGGGIAGVAAASAAARFGCRVSLIERFGFLGGWATAALVNPFMTHYSSDGTPLVGGLFEEMRERLTERKALSANCFDPEQLKLVLQEMALEAGVGLRLHTIAERARLEADDRMAIEVISKSGREVFHCLRLIDCSGDGDAAASMGAQFESGDSDGLQQAATLMFDVGGVDLQRAMTYVRDHPDQMRFPKLLPDTCPEQLAEGIISVAGYYDLVGEARARGEYECPGDLVFYVGRARKGEVTFNTTHIGNVDGTSVEDLTRAEIKGRRQMQSLVSFVQKYLPGFEDAYLLRSPAHVGIRETRRIVGHYVLGADDVVQGRKFEDAICRLAYPVDVHPGKGDGYTRSEEKTAPQGPPPGDWYEIPYRCLIPLGVDRTLVAGRCVSSTQEGHGAIRIMPSCAAAGEAAGTAAAMSIASGVEPANLDGTLVRAELRRRGALL